MLTAVRIGAAIVAVEHLWFLVLEMFLWTHPIGLKMFRTTAEVAEASKTLAANQGLYNGFLAAGLIYGAATGRLDFLVFFLVCVVVAGIYGGFTASRAIFFVQALPAAIVLALALLR